MNVGDLGKLIVAKGFKKLPKVQKITQSGHTEYNLGQWWYFSWYSGCFRHPISAILFQSSANFIYHLLQY